MSTDASNTSTIAARLDTPGIETSRPVRYRDETAIGRARRASEEERAAAYPIGRWYVRPVAGLLARWLAPTRVRPNHLSICGLAAATGAAILVVWNAEASLLAAILVLLYWFFDRADGQLARCQATESRWGAWLDGNVDELVDLGLHTAMAAVLAYQVASPWPWWLLIGFIAGKYLFMYGLALEEHAGFSRKRENLPAAGLEGRDTSSRRRLALLRRAYHLPGNADVRLHLLAAALATGWWAVELAWIAGYYNFRWIVRYWLVAKRLGGTP